MGLSGIGIFHTIIGIIAILAAMVSFIKYGSIHLGKLTGRIYFFGTLVTSFTALAISKHGGFNPGHLFSIIIVVLVSLAYFLHVKKKGQNRSRYIENFLLSFSFFLSWLPTINETFTRIPIGHPWAKAPTDPVIAKTLIVLLVLFIVGSFFQVLKQRKMNRAAR